MSKIKTIECKNVDLQVEIRDDQVRIWANNRDFGTNEFRLKAMGKVHSENPHDVVVECESLTKELMDGVHFTVG